MNARIPDLSISRWPWVILVALALTSCDQPRRALKKNAAIHRNKPIVLITLIDGLRHDYIDRYQPPNLTRIAEQGLRAKALRPTYPSDTAPNLYSLVTGVHAGRHGILGNTFYSRAQGEAYSLFHKKRVRETRWYGARPLWRVAESEQMVSGAIAWAGAEDPDHVFGASLTTGYPYKKKDPARLTKLAEWLLLPPEHRPHLILLYLDDIVDAAGHGHGPDSPMIGAALKKADRSVGNILKLIKQSKFPVNLIVASDHGMVRLNEKNNVYLDEVANLEGFIIHGRASKMFLYAPGPAAREKAYQNFRAHAAKTGGYEVYKRGSFPPETHFNSPDPDFRLPDILLMARYPRTIVFRDKSSLPPGGHGYPVEQTPDLKGSLLAMGPAFRAGVTIPEMSIVDIYPLVLRLLELPPDPSVDGKLDGWAPGLRR